MDIYLTIMVTILVITQVVRITQNTIQLHRQNILFKEQLSQLKDVTQEDFIHLSIEDHHVDILAGSQKVIQTAEADVVCPAVAAEDPDGLLGNVLLALQDLCRLLAAGSSSLLQLSDQGLCGLVVGLGVVLGCDELLVSSLQLSRSLVGTSNLCDLLDQVLADGLLADVQAQTMLCVILEQGVAPCRTMAAVLVDGVRRDGSGAAPDGGAAGSVGDVHLLAEQLSDQTSVRSLGTACAGAGELQQRLVELRTDDGIVSKLGRLLGDVGNAVVEHCLLICLAVLRDHGDGLGGADGDALAAAHACLLYTSMQRMAAILPDDDATTYFGTSVWTHAKQRIPWLLILMLSATFTGMVTTHYEEAFTALPLLVSFMPMLMDTAGNCGNQISTLMVRGLALGEVEPADFMRVLGKELRVSAIVGAVLGIVNGLRIYLMYTFLFPGQYANVMGYAIVVSVSLFFSVILAKLVGGMLPLAAKKLGADPAIMATPFITTIVDACSLILYFQIAQLVFRNMM